MAVQNLDLISSMMASLLKKATQMFTGLVTYILCTYIKFGSDVLIRFGIIKCRDFVKRWIKKADFDVKLWRHRCCNLNDKYIFLIDLLYTFFSYTMLNITKFSKPTKMFKINEILMSLWTFSSGVSPEVEYTIQITKSIPYMLSFWSTLFDLMTLLIHLWHWKAIEFCKNQVVSVNEIWLKKSQPVRELCVIFHPDIHTQTHKRSNEHPCCNTFLQVIRGFMELANTHPVTAVLY